MTTEQNNKQVILDLMRAVDARQLARLADFYHADFREPDREPATGPRAGLEGMRAGLAAFMQAFDDYSHVVHDLVAEGDRVAARITFSGVFARPLFGAPPTGRRVTATSVAIYRLANGKIQEKWGYFDALQFLGVRPRD
jgi:predicted ester cyclase